MKIALKEARIAAKCDEVPVGAVIVKDDRIISEAHNEREKKLDISSHAEIEAIKKAAKNLGRWDLTGCTIYVTLEPCLMCLGAIIQSRISRIVFGAKDEKEGAIVSKYNILSENTGENSPLVSLDVLGEESSLLLKTFFKSKRK